MHTESAIGEIARELDEHLRVVRQILRRPIDSEVARGHLTAPQQLVMEAVVRAGGLSLKQLSERVSLSHSTVSGIVDRLQKRGFLLRRVDSKDRRYTVITPSKPVQDFMRKRIPVLTLHPLADVLKLASSSEREEILRGVRVLRRLMEQSTANQKST
ncbi:MAG TPA: MarR family transcriptional regulator [Terriglobales bacterium]|nr:MarR family transcriptional regulator [Terriglobales bacterium]